MVHNAGQIFLGLSFFRFLLAEARRSGMRTTDGVSVNLTQTNQQIASQVGSVREVISRAFSRLQQDGLIVVEDRKLTILDEKALAAFAELG